MKQTRALLFLAGLAMLPSLWRIVRPDPQPLAVRSTEYTAEADRVFFGEKIDLNRADVAALMLVPGIGPSLAARIVDDRARNGPFRSLSDVERVPGIGPAKAAALSEWTEIR